MNKLYHVGPYCWADLAPTLNLFFNFYFMINVVKFCIMKQCVTMSCSWTVNMPTDPLHEEPENLVQQAQIGL